MKYKAKLLYRGVESVGYGDNDHAAIQAALNECVVIREARTPDVAVVLWHVYEAGSHREHVSYATTLYKYNNSIA